MKTFNFNAYYRILWREAAEQYPLCIGIFSLLVMLQVSMETMETFNLINTPSIGFAFGMALFMTAIYAASCSALLLVAETDNGTFMLHRMQPISAFTYLSAKLCWVAASSVLLGIAVWLETFVWQGGTFPGGQETSEILGICGVGVLEGMAWGVVASMLFREPLRAVVAGIALASLGAWFVTAGNYVATGGGSMLVTTAYYNAAWPRVVVALVILAIDFPLVRIWFRTGKPLWETLLQRRNIALTGATNCDASCEADLARQWAALPEPRRGRAIRLLWQAWRQVRTPALIFWALCIAGSILSFIIAHEANGPKEDRFILATMMTTWGIVIIASILVGYTFGADQRSRFLQLARDGVSPWEIWTSRLVVMPVILLPPTLFLLGSYWVALGDWPGTRDAGDVRSFTWPLFVLITILGYVTILTVGQACSMYFRSRVIALFAAPVMIGCMAFWIAMGVFYLGLGWQLGLLPMLVALLIGTRLLTGTRLRQDNSWRAMRLPALLIIGAIVFTYQAFAYHRVHEVPLSDRAVNGLDLMFASLYPDEILRQSNHWPGSPSFDVSECKDYFKEKLFDLDDDQFAKRSSSIGFHWRSLYGTGWCDYYDEDVFNQEQILNRLLRQAAALPGVTNERLKPYLDFMQRWSQERPSYARWLDADFAQDLYWLQYGPMMMDDSRCATYRGFHEEPLPWNLRMFKFERDRALRILMRAHLLAVERTQAYEEKVLNDHICMNTWGMVDFEEIIPYDPTQSPSFQLQKFEGGGGFVEKFHLIRSLENIRSGERWDDFYQAEADRRATVLYIALRMYYNDHGALPETLDSLVDENYLDKLPVVPIFLRAFSYESQGEDAIPQELVEILSQEDVAANDSNKKVFLDNLKQHDFTKPFLWYPWSPFYPKHMPRNIDGSWNYQEASFGTFIDLDFVGDKPEE